jgi:enterochelin esterase-like enzyme
MKTFAAGLLALTLTFPLPGLAQRGGNSWENQGNLPVSPEVHPDRSVTFRLFAPKASEVLLVGGPMIAVMGGPKPLVKDERGLWSVTVGPIPAGYYNYGFAVDGGIRSPDPANPNIEHRQWGHTSFFIVDDTQAQLFQAWKVPHGTVHILTYDSKSLGLARRAFVYTPPGYEETPDQRLPVLYLLHGSGLLEEAWVETGQVNLILDNLLSQGKIKPMVVVMPYGSVAGGDQPQGPGGPAAPAQPNRGGRGGGGFENDLLNEVRPMVEAKFHVLNDREHRAIAGLSMGADQAATIGLGHLDLFSAIGAFSGNGIQLGSHTPEELNAKLQAMMISVGRQDPAFGRNQQTSQTFDQGNINHVFLTPEGGHIWPVWQLSIAQFTPLLFQDKAGAPAAAAKSAGAPAQN